MPEFRAMVGRVRSLSPPQAVLDQAGAEARTGSVTVTFENGRVGVLDLAIPRSIIWARRIDRQRERDLPVYVEIDDETSAITELLVPEVSRVLELTTASSGDIDVRLLPSPARHRLMRVHPDFDAMRAVALAAKDEGFEVLVTTARRTREIVDLRRYVAPGVPTPPRPGEPPEPPPGGGPPPPPPAPVSEQRASELFDQMAATACDCSVAPPCIPFAYPTDGCYARAHEMCHLMQLAGETPEKVWIYASVDTSLAPSAPSDPDCVVQWWYHVAPTLRVTTPSGTALRVIDPSLCDGPVSPDAWRDLQEHAAGLEYTGANQFLPGGTEDPNYTLTKQYLQDRRDDLAEQCATYGPPPYSCPIVKTCQFIIDRSTFGEDEIAARLQQATPARIDAAFYVVLDGLAPAELQITQTTSLEPPSVVPALGIAPNVSGFSATPTRLAMDFPQYPERRQRMTWIYQVEFTDVAAFVSDIPVSLTATIHGLSASATIYLIRQPNPYEIDGLVSWLSTDLRVFQVKAGASKFGATMGNDATAASSFITDVLARLNAGTTGGQTFEVDLSTDQETSKLELAESIGGVRVFNFAVARVRYRAKQKEAKDVRVFFRLFSTSTTSLAYDLATAYGRGGQNGVAIPLLGTQNQDVVSIPCFAAPRIDSAAASMDTQTDPDNVHTLPVDSTGAEVVWYFGCWLDINQHDQPQFPLVAPGDHGPFPAAERRSIYEHVRNRHQCLVAEIAFALDPIPAGATPGSSDKLAQRNLAICESANPGVSGSRRIPNTFEIRVARGREHTGVGDELMIDSTDTPPGSVATLYLPGASVSRMASLALQQYRSHHLAILDDHTLRWPTGSVTYLPIPADAGPVLAGLLTIDLAATVRYGQVFRVVARQVTDARDDVPVVRSLASRGAPSASRRGWRRIIGSYQITIPVRHKEDILASEERALANLRWIQRSIPDGNRWVPVFGRYVEQVAARVDALGGDSSAIAPSPSGDPRPAPARRCRALACATAIALALFVVALGCLGRPLAVAALVLCAVVAAIWVRRCKPSSRL